MHQYIEHVKHPVAAWLVQLRSEQGRTGVLEAAMTEARSKNWYFTDAAQKASVETMSTTYC